MNRQQLINKANQLGLTIKSENMETISKMIRVKENEIYQKLNSERKANHIKRVWNKTEIKPKRFQIIRDVIYQGRKWSEDVLEVDDLSDYFDNCLFLIESTMFEYKIKNIKKGGKIMNRQQLINKANQLGLTIKSENMETISKMIRIKEEEVYQKLNSERKVNHIKRVWNRNEIKPKRFQIIRDVMYQGRKWSEDVLEVDNLRDYFDTCLFLIESTMFEYRIKDINGTRDS